MSDGPLPLEGVRIVDFAQVFAGPACTRILADLGADVIRFEAPARLDVTRNLIITDNDGMDHHWHRASYFVIRNASKREMVVDLAKEEAREIVRKLVATADVFVESFTPRVMANFGLHYEGLKEIKPDIIMCSLSGYGQYGPMRDYAGYGMGLEPASGVSSITGYRDGPPMRSGLSFTDPYSGFVGAGAILTALHYRRRTGKGQYIDLSEQEAAIPIVGAALLEYQMNGRLSPRIGDRSPWFAPQGCYRCAGDDRWVTIACFNEAEWSALVKVAEHREWGSDPRFVTLDARLAHQNALDALIGEWTGSRDPYQIMYALQQAGVPAGVCQTAGDRCDNDPQLKHLEWLTEVTGTKIGRWPIAEVPVKMSESPAYIGGRIDRGAPMYGEDNEYVYGELLGMSSPEIKALAADGVI